MISPPGEQGVGSGGGLGNLESGMRFLGKPIRNRCGCTGRDTPLVYREQRSDLRNPARKRSDRRDESGIRHVGTEIKGSKERK